ncbi:hypothetical protein [Streptomyces sp. WAC08241]|uniref:hypothetical protein n=1 Tax=Streptomyces sp. WAC08241 TaxID=2487421 RepID=UPI000F7A3273|nr:hypothetical protein [Streptomyces sp. WAC08241]RSS44554.1 hypothetical protein EF906_06920 [Streptomyces sp. WAC08241]
MIVIRRLAGIAALPTALLLLTACSGGDNGDAHAKAQPSQHPVFGQPLGRQVFLALRETQKSGSASFTQTVSFGSAKGTAVQTLSGRLDFTEGAGEAAVRWQVPEKYSAAAEGTLLGTTPGRTSGTGSGRFVVDRQQIHYRAASAGYWLRYGSDDVLAAGDGNDPIGHLRGSESPVGGTLLEGLGGAEAKARQEEPAGGRTYRAEMPFSVGWTMFPSDLRKELAAEMGTSALQAGFPLTVSVDARGRITHGRADMSRLLRKSGALADVTSLTMDLTLTGFGSSKPAGPPAGSVRKAAEAVLPMRDVKNGGCVDFDTGRRATHVVVGVPCSGPYDARVFVQVPLRPGATAAETQERADIACSFAHDVARPAWVPKAAEIWSWWTPGHASGPGGEDRVTCYLTAERGGSQDG